MFYGSYTTNDRKLFEGLLKAREKLFCYDFSNEESQTSQVFSGSFPRSR